MYLSEGITTVEVTNNLQQFSASLVVFEYVNHVVHGLEPTAGPTSGGTLLSIRESRMIEPNSVASP